MNQRTLISLSPLIRILSGVLGSVILIATLILPFVMPIQNASDGTPLANISELTRYFTIWVNVATALILFLSAIKGRWLSFQFLSACTVWMILVGFGYHAVIAPFHNPVGWDAMVNFVHHTIAPLGLISIWYFSRSREKLNNKHPFRWLILPATYSIYAVVRGVAYDSFFPYPFLDPNFRGWTFFLMILIGSIATLIVIGFMIVRINVHLAGKEKGRLGEQ